MLLWTLTSLVALAQDTTATGGETPDIDAQLFTPSMDSERFTRLTESALPEPGLVWRATLSYTREPLKYTGATGGTSWLLQDLVQLDLAAAWATETFRVGLNLPVVGHRFDGSSFTRPGLRDLTLDAKLLLFDDEDRPAGSAVSARVSLPTSTLQSGLGTSGPSAELELALDKDVGAVRLLGTFAFVYLPSYGLENVQWGSQLRAGLGASLALRDSLSAHAEWTGALVLADPWNGAGHPSELLVGGQGVVKERFVVRPGVAIGLNDAVGTPKYRVMLAVARTRPDAASDLDGDGLVDELDSCPEVAEDLDGYEDTDGCPEDTRVQISVTDTDGEAVVGVPWRVGDQQGVHGDLAELPAGPHTFTVGDLPIEVAIPDGPPTRAELEIPAPRGQVLVHAVDPEGRPVPGATWSARGPGQLQDEPTETPVELRPGTWWLRVQAPGHHPNMAEAEVPRDDPIEVSVVLAPNPHDSDGDGLVDDADACPARPEDFDGWQDTDGCPEPTRVVVELVDSDGFDVEDRTWSVPLPSGDSGEASGTSGDEVSLPAGPHVFAVGPTQQAVAVPPGPPTTVTLQVPSIRGRLLVNVVDEEGEPVSTAVWHAMGPVQLEGQPANEEVAVRPGSYWLRAEAPGYRRAEGSVEVAQDAEATLTLTLPPARAALVRDRIELRDSVFFETDSATLDPQSHELLVEVAEIILDHPELALVRVEGHTDARGTDAYNLDLSDRRAASVVDFLEAQGVEPGLLVSEGFGEGETVGKAHAHDRRR